MGGPAIEPDPLDEEVLSRLEISRRELVRRLVVGTAFAVPVVASFDMSSLTVSTADASSPNQSNFHQPAIVSASAAAFTVGEAGTFTVSSTGTPTPSLSEAGGLPPAVDFTDNGDGTATIAGTPSSGSQGSYGIELTAANGHPPDAKQAFTLSVDLAPAITSGAAASLVVATEGSFTIDTTG
ncbi:MAG: hypothetical protein ACRDL8_03265, partial [Solirubrobacteraceae bacterium]